jgi:ATP-dependent helicase/nuclease subunit A
MNEGPADAEARDWALDPAASFIVDAPAGSGKTTLLTQRFLRLLALSDQPESIVAITFTRKAAEEMRGRILSSLRAAQDDPNVLDPVTRRWASAALTASLRNDWRLLESPRRLRVQTIDSLSATLARRGPLMSGYAGGAEVREDSAQLYREAACATITILGENGVWSAAVQSLLRHLDNDWQRLEGLLVEMLGRRDQWLRFVAQHPQRKMFEKALEVAVRDELKQVADMLPRHLSRDMLQVCTFAGANLAREDPADPGASLAGLTELPGTSLSDLAPWQALAWLFLTKDGKLRQRATKTLGLPTKGPGTVEHKELFGALIQELAGLPALLVALNNLRSTPDPRYSDDQWASIEALFTVLKLAAAELKITFNQNSAVDFVEIAHAAVAALGDAQDPSDLGLILDYQIQHLLIDEFQDTSITQYELVERLLDGWTDGDGRTLFLVGDPMQSIYRFRQADVSLFIDTCTAGRLAAVRLQVLQLNTNFRAQGAVIDWINGAVEKMCEDIACPFEQMPRLVAARAETDPGAVKTHLFVTDEVAAEADAVLEIVRQSQADRPTATIGILVRGRRHLGAIINTLTAAGIAVSASEIESLSAQTIVQDLVALTRALLHRADRTAWLGVLRAPWCGLSLKSLATLFEARGDGTIWQLLGDDERRNKLEPAAAFSLRRFIEIIRRALDAVGREPLAPLLEETWLALGGPGIYPASEQIHAAHYFEILETCTHREPLVTAKRLDALLERQYVAPPALAESTVAIMTIHRAKGLEFDVVILPGLARAPRAEQHRLLNWRTHVRPTGRSLLFAPIPGVGSGPDKIHSYLRLAEKKELEDEAYRLLYVALTRSREHLHLIGSVKESPAGGHSMPAARSFLRMLWGAIEQDVGASANVGLSAAHVASIAPSMQTIRRPLITEDDAGSLSVSREHKSPLLAASDVEFAWASPVAKHIGTVTHTILQLICRDKLPQRNARRIEGLAPYIEGRLRGLGVAIDDVLVARDQIITAVVSVVDSERGQWIMDERHESAASEYALTSIVEGRVINIIIDRTFIDEYGTRWIIDFKTGSHAGGAEENFIATEVERYRPQLERYAQIMHQRERVPIALGLFFPLLGAWREWHHTSKWDARDSTPA